MSDKEIKKINHKLSWPNASVFEEYSNYSEIKQLIDNVHFTKSLKNECKTIAVISQISGEGKSFFTAVLAYTFAKFLNNKVLIIDTVTEDGIFDKAKKSAIDKGLLDVEVISSQFENIDLLHLYKSRYNEYQLSSIIEDFKSEYSMIFFDTCAFSLKNLNNLDPFVIARRCDNPILVMSKVTSSKRSMAKVKSILSQQDIKLLGVVYNEACML
jgi:Mrp family chromosome partitioning ATPase